MYAKAARRPSGCCFRMRTAVDAVASRTLHMQRWIYSGIASKRAKMPVHNYIKVPVDCVSSNSR